MKNIILIGFMGTGKTTLGRVLAQKLGRTFVDTDQEIEKKLGMTVAEIFDKHGSEYFRTQEALIIKEFSSISNLVIATGGGAVLNPANVAILKKSGQTVLLCSSGEEILKRLDSTESRPLLSSARDVKSRIEELLIERESSYEAAADFKVNVDNLDKDAIAEKIIDLLPKKNRFVTDQVTIDLGARSYTIHVGHNLLSCLKSRLREIVDSNKVMIVTNPEIDALYGNILKTQLEALDIFPVMGVIPEGERYKSLATAERLYDIAYKNEVDRQTPIIALGGGVIGDLAGFVAATYMRGVPFIQIPTTLLAQVDSSVGGKVAVNHPRGKNIIGAFYQPEAVFTDLSTLDTLPEREIRAGLAEVIKYGVIFDGEFFVWLEDNIEKVLALNPEAIKKVVTISCQSKAAVVKEDETEQGIRAILNYGHTLGHAVEALTNYKVYRHGEAVSIGMAAAARLAVNMGGFDQASEKRIIGLLKRAGLPVDIPVKLNRDNLLSLMKKDKKAVSSKLTFVLPVSIGSVEIIKDIDEKVVLKSI
ncbi:MAG: 3-dehydroquinate synthase [Peptococcaceae bacterium]|nr:3-dehydroquinate synthase [Peptococcaceae bacterium]